MEPSEVSQVLVDCFFGDREFESGETILMPT